MKPNKLVGLVAAGLILPSASIAFGNSGLASEVTVQTNNVEAITRSDGSIYVNTGAATINLPRRETRPYWNPWRYWSFPWQSSTDAHSRASDRQCHQSSYQSTQQTSHAGNYAVQHSSYRHSCD